MVSLAASGVSYAQADLFQGKLKTEQLDSIKALTITNENTQVIYLVRHGESTSNLPAPGQKFRLVSGKSPAINLTENGHLQIEQLAKKISELIDKKSPLVIAFSALSRTQQSAQILFQHMSQSGHNVILLGSSFSDLDERSLGSWEGKLRDEKYLEATTMWKAKSAKEKFSSPEVESAETCSDVADRALKGMEEIYKQYPNATVFVVSSYLTINSAYLKKEGLIPNLSSEPDTEIPKIEADNGDLICLESVKSGRFEDLHFVSHIKRTSVQTKD